MLRWKTSFFIRFNTFFLSHISILQENVKSNLSVKFWIIYFSQQIATQHWHLKDQAKIIGEEDWNVKLRIENWRWSSLNAKHIRLQRSLRSVTAVSVGPADSRLWEGKHSEWVPQNVQWATLSESFYPSLIYPWVLRTHGYRAVTLSASFLMHFIFPRTL